MHYLFDEFAHQELCVCVCVCVCVCERERERERESYQDHGVCLRGRVYVCLYAWVHYLARERAGGGERK